MWSFFCCFLMTAAILFPEMFCNPELFWGACAHFRCARAPIPVKTITFARVKTHKHNYSDFGGKFCNGPQVSLSFQAEETDLRPAEMPFHCRWNINEPWQKHLSPRLHIYWKLTVRLYYTELLLQSYKIIIFTACIKQRCISISVYTVDATTDLVWGLTLLTLQLSFGCSACLASL